MSSCQWTSIWSFHQSHTRLLSNSLFEPASSKDSVRSTFSAYVMEAVAEDTWMFPGAWILEDLGWLVFIDHVQRADSIHHPLLESIYLITFRKLRYQVMCTQSAGFLPSLFLPRDEDSRECCMCQAASPRNKQPSSLFPTRSFSQKTIYSKLKKHQADTAAARSPPGAEWFYHSHYLLVQLSSLKLWEFLHGQMAYDCSLLTRSPSSFSFP